MYTIEILETLRLCEIKQIAESLSTRPTEGDARRKKDWIEAIVYAVAGTVPASYFDEPDSIECPGHVPDTDEAPAEVEEALKQQIDATCEAERAAILTGDKEEAARLSAEADELLDKYQKAIEAQMSALARGSMDICEQAASIEAAPRVFWVSGTTGTVTIGEESCRSFRVVGDWRQKDPTIKLMTSKGEISSEWRTTRNNRYINAVKDDIARRLSKHLAANIDFSRWADGFVPQYDSGAVVGFQYQPAG